jgi:hypothetical protein
MEFTLRHAQMEVFQEMQLQLEEMQFWQGTWQDGTSLLQSVQLSHETFRALWDS